MQCPMGDRPESPVAVHSPPRWSNRTGVWSLPVQRTWRWFCHGRFFSSGAHVIGTPRRGKKGELRLQGPEHAELIAVRIGQNHPRYVGCLAHRRWLRTQTDETLNLGILVIRPQVEVKAVLDRLVLRHTQEQDVRRYSILRTPGRRLQNHLVLIIMRAPPTERSLPEGRDAGRIVRVETDTLNAKGHSLA